MSPARRAVQDGAFLALTAMAVAVAAWLFVRSGSFTFTRFVSTQITSHLDFDTFWRSAVAFREGGDIYATGATYPNLNPPLFTVLLSPLGLLDVFEGYRVMALVSVVLMVGCLVVVARETGASAGDTAVVTAAVLVSSPFVATIGLGQIYVVLTAGLTLYWLAVRRGWTRVEPVVLGVVIALKPSLALLLLLPLVRRRRRTAVVAAVVAVVASGAAFLLVGHSALSTWVGLVLRKPLETYFDNASLPATVVRLFTVNDWGDPLVALPGALVIGYVLAAAAVVGTLWRVAAVREAAADAAGIWAVAAASLLASPLTWNNYLLLLVPGVLVVLVDGRRPAAYALLALPLIGMEWPPLWFGTGPPPALPLSLYCGILLLHWAVLTVAVRPSDRVLPDRQRVAAEPRRRERHGHHHCDDGGPTAFRQPDRDREQQHEGRQQQP